MKTKEELNAIKKEVEAMNKKLHDLNDKELEQVTGGLHRKRIRYQEYCPNCEYIFCNKTIIEGEVEEEEIINPDFNYISCPQCQVLVSPKTRTIRAEDIKLAINKKFV